MRKPDYASVVCQCRIPGNESSYFAGMLVVCKNQALEIFIYKYPVNNTINLINLFNPFKAFKKCAHNRTFSLAWACRKEHRAMKECMDK